MNQKRTDIAELGEFGLIEHLTGGAMLRQKTSIKGVGDDAAVMDTSGEKYLLAATDLLLEGIHFDLMYAPLKHLGYKAVVVNLSDIYAMNGSPTQILVSVGLSNRFSLEALDELYAGIYLACSNYGVDLVGGDTSSSMQGLVLSITAMGEAEKNKVVYRSGAKEGDTIFVSGDLGAAYLGLQLLEREKRIFMENPGIQTDLEGQDYLVGRQLKPEARNDVIELFEKLDIVPTAMIDVSDGLSSDLLHICKQSDLSCHIFEENIPLHQDTFNMAQRFNITPRHLCFKRRRRLRIVVYPISRRC